MLRWRRVPVITVPSCRVAGSSSDWIGSYVYIVMYHMLCIFICIHMHIYIYIYIWYNNSSNGTGVKHATDCNADETAAGEPCTGTKSRGCLFCKHRYGMRGHWGHFIRDVFEDNARREWSELLPGSWENEGWSLKHVQTRVPYNDKSWHTGKTSRQSIWTWCVWGCRGPLGVWRGGWWEVELHTQSYFPNELYASGFPVVVTTTSNLHI